MKISKKKLGLFVAHNLYLNREQRYKLADGETLDLIASSLPVWIMTGTTTTSEPASEVFCQYTVYNNGEDKESIKFEDGKYLIWLPTCKDDHDMERPPDDEWRLMTNTEQEDWYIAHPIHPCGRRLRDAKDKGNEGYLRFDQHRKINGKNGGLLTLVHCIQFKPIEALMESLI